MLDKRTMSCSPKSWGWGLIEYWQALTAPPFGEDNTEIAPPCIIMSKLCAASSVIIHFSPTALARNFARQQGPSNWGVISVLSAPPGVRLSTSF